MRKYLLLEDILNSIFEIRGSVPQPLDSLPASRKKLVPDFSGVLKG